MLCRGARTLEQAANDLLPLLTTISAEQKKWFALIPKKWKPETSLKRILVLTMDFWHLYIHIYIYINTYIRINMCVYACFLYIYIYTIYSICGEPHHFIVRDQKWRALLTPKIIFHPTNHTGISSAQPERREGAEGEWGKQKGRTSLIKYIDRGFRLLRKRQNKGNNIKKQRKDINSNMVQFFVEQWLDHLQVLIWSTISWNISCKDFFTVHIQCCLELKEINTSGHHLTHSTTPLAYLYPTQANQPAFALPGLNKPRKGGKRSLEKKQKGRPWIVVQLNIYDSQNG